VLTERLRLLVGPPLFLGGWSEFLDGRVGIELADGRLEIDGLADGRLTVVDAGLFETGVVLVGFKVGSELALLRVEVLEGLGRAPPENDPDLPPLPPSWAKLF
jgi:hypothetical protein